VRLCFLRHGPAGDPSDWDGADEERPLTEHGRAVVHDVARLMTGRGIAFDAVLTSPYLRAAQTAAIVAEETGVRDVSADPRLAPGFGSRDLDELISENSAKSSLLVVGHEPDMSEAICRLAGGGRVRMKKAALACLHAPDPASDAWSLDLLIPPGVKEP
jgi:phosphohistidine phosphatase